MIHSSELDTLKKSHVVAIVSGKGGVGKTNAASNLAISAAAAGKKVLLCDGDLGLANVDVLLGLSPKFTIRDVLESKGDLRQAMVSGPLGITVLAACSGYTDMAELDTGRFELFRNLFQHAALSFDYVIIDTPTGISLNMQRLAALAHEIVLITTPEPTAVMDAYAVAKILSVQMPAAPIRLLVNMVSQLDAGERIAIGFEEVASKFLRRKIETIAHMPLDPHVPLAVRRQIPFSLCYPNCPAARTLRQMCQRMGVKSISKFVNSAEEVCATRTTHWPKRLLG